MPKSPWRKPRRSTTPEDGAGPDGPDAPGGDGSGGEDAPPKARRSARNTAMDLLSRREHSVAELRAKLQAREFDEAEIEPALAALQAEGLLSEARFLENFVGSHVRRGHGPVWIRGELERRGIAGEAIAEALASADVDWDAAAEAVRVKRFGPAVPTDFRERARQVRFLQYRGFRK